MTNSKHSSKILITGASGLIGSRLTQMLLNSGQRVAHLGRSKKGKTGVEEYVWDLEAGTVEEGAFEGVEHVIHLAGAGIADKPWTEERKREIIDSRTATADLLLKTCKAQNIRLKSLVSASAIGWYPLDPVEEVLTESSEPGTGFLAEVCQKWESTVDHFSEDVAKRVVKIRIGLVLALEGGALPKMMLPVNYFVGSPLGSGHQAMSWIHIDDICGMFIHAVQNPLVGVYNGTGPEFATNEDFMQTLADLMDRALLLPNVPNFVMKMILGQMAPMVLKGNQISSKKIIESGYSFTYPTLNTALSDLLSKR